MKIYLIQNILSIYFEKWPCYYYLADFILSHIIGHEKFYYNFNKPDYFSLAGKEGVKVSIFDFIDSVANIPINEVSFKQNYLPIVKELIKCGAPIELFLYKYLDTTKC